MNDDDFEALMTEWRRRDGQATRISHVVLIASIGLAIGLGLGVYVAAVQDCARRGGRFMFGGDLDLPACVQEVP